VGQHCGGARLHNSNRPGAYIAQLNSLAQGRQRVQKIYVWAETGFGTRSSFSTEPPTYLTA